jgi:hypothetical protein
MPAILLQDDSDSAEKACACDSADLVAPVQVPPLLLQPDFTLPRPVMTFNRAVLVPAYLA